MAEYRACTYALVVVCLSEKWKRGYIYTCRGDEPTLFRGGYLSSGPV